MPIQSSDIKLLESERMTDATDGGGRRTSRVVLDGVAGNVFPKVSRVDSVYGRVNLRKVYGHVDTPTVETFAGAHFIITDAPNNDRIHVTAFSTGSEFDQRTAARDRVESYVVAGPESRMQLYGRQLAGSSAILVYQKESEAPPEIGEVLALTREGAGVTPGSQFVTVQSVAQEVRTFTDAIGDFKAAVITIGIGSPLLTEYAGLDSPSRISANKGSGRVRLTRVSDSSRYFGIKPVAAPVAEGAFGIRVPSIFTPVVPTAQRETGLSLLRSTGARVQQAAGTVPVTDSTPEGYLRSIEAGTARLHLRNAVLPGSVTLSLPRPSAAPLIVTDNAVGGFTGVSYFTNVSIDYEQGVVQFSFPITFFADFHVASATYIPAGVLELSAHSDAIDITVATRGTVYAPSFLPPPAAGTLTVEYRALGRWYVLRDIGNGTLAGSDPSYGTGTVNYVTGGAVVTLGALPDVGSRVLLRWGSAVHAVPVTNDASPSASLLVDLGSPYVSPADTTVQFTQGGVLRTATVSNMGVVSGSGLGGALDRFNGRLALNFTGALPDPGSTVRVDFRYNTDQVAAWPDSGVLSGAFAAGLGASAGQALGLGSVRVLCRVGVPFPYPVSAVSVQLVDNGQGQLVLQSGTFLDTQRSTKVRVDTVVGSVNHSTGQITLDTSVSIPLRQDLYYTNGGQWGFKDLTTSIVPDSTASFSARRDSSDPTDAQGVKSVVLPAEGLQIRLTRTVGRTVVPGSVRFNFAGKIFVDRAGSLYTDIITSSGAGTLAGTIDYSTGVCNVTTWNATTGVPNLTVVSCLTAYGDFTATDVQFRTAGSPLRVGSLYVQVALPNGTVLSATSDTNGAVQGSQIVGQVDYVSGVVRLSFGQMVSAAGNESEPWYDPANVVGGMIWRPTEVLPGTLRYSAVVLSSLPVNSAILGLDPVRLPSDGRVPIFKPADVVVLHHTASLNLGTPAQGATISMGRNNLAALWLEDSAGTKLPTTLYVPNLGAGSVTIATDAVFTSYVTPLVARHRIEDMLLLSDVQINGELTTAAAVSRDYPMGSMLSSALLFGDLYARVAGVFDQLTWTGAWSDVRIGDQANAQYDDVNYPIEVLNDGAVTERWRINFTSSTAYQLIGENLGVIATGSTTSDLVPANTLTGKPYLRIRWQGFGAGWATGNQIRFNTVAAAPPVWLARTTLPGATLEGDSFDAQLRGDVD